MKHTRTKHSWFRGMKRGKESPSADAFLSETMVPRVSREAYCSPTRPVPDRGYGYREFAPVLVKAKEKRPSAPPPAMADFGAATDRQERNLTAYRAMSQEERAEWIGDKTTAPYVPPFVKVEPRWAVGAKRSA